MIIDREEYYKEIEQIERSSGIPWTKLEGKRVLVTGASGMIGSYIIDLLMLHNHKSDKQIEIYALSRSKKRIDYRFNHTGYAESLNIVEHDICKPLNIEVDVDYIIHAASNTHPLEYSQNPVETITTNVIGLKNIYEYARMRHNCRVVILSSVEIYGENRGDADKYNEDYCGYIDCNTLRAGYPESKRLCETMAQAYKHQYDIDSVIVRLSRVYGAGVEPDDSKAMTQFLNKAVSHEDIVLKSDGRQLYSYIYIADAVTAILKIALMGESGQAYNVADPGSDSTLREAAEKLAEIAGTRVRFELPDEAEKRGYSTATKAILNGEKLKKLGWNARYNMEDGLRQTLKMMGGI